MWCFGTSLSIELIQLVAGGVTSADDLLLNTLGGALRLRGGKAADESVPQASRRQAREGQSGQHRLVCWIVIIAASTISDLLILW